MKQARILPLLVLILSLAASSHAATKGKSVDKALPTQVEADRLSYDDRKQIGTFTGNVVLRRGTLVLKAQKMVVSQDAEGYQYATLYAAPSKLASFRQKRSGEGNMWIEGQAAERIEFNSKTEVVKLFGQARVILLDGTEPTDQVEGEFISYDSRTEFYTVNNSPNGEAKSEKGRVRVTIQPRAENKGK